MKHRGAWIDKLKQLMYSDIDYSKASEINNIILMYDEERAKNDEELARAGREWYYRLQKLCDHRAKRGYK